MCFRSTAKGKHPPFDHLTKREPRAGVWERLVLGITQEQLLETLRLQIRDNRANSENGSVTFTAISLAPISLAKATPCSTALAARSHRRVQDLDILVQWRSPLAFLSPKIIGVFHIILRTRRGEIPRFD
jgi:hypothetical protein